MTTEADETLIRQILFRHRANLKGGVPNTPAEVAAIRFGYHERLRILAEQEEARAQGKQPAGSRTARGRRSHRPTSDGLLREDER